MPIFKSKKEDQEKLDGETMVRGTISVELSKSNIDQIVRRGYTEAISQQLKIILFYDPVYEQYEKERKIIDEAWAIQQGNREKKTMPIAQLKKVTKAFEKKYGC